MIARITVGPLNGGPGQSTRSEPENRPARVGWECKIPNTVTGGRSLRPAAGRRWP